MADTISSLMWHFLKIGFIYIFFKNFKYFWTKNCQELVHNYAYNYWTYNWNCHFIFFDLVVDVMADTFLPLKRKLDDICHNCWCNGQHDLSFKKHSWWKFSILILSYMISIYGRPNIRYQTPFNVLNWQLYIIWCSFLCNGRHILTFIRIFFIPELLFHYFLFL